MINKLKSAGLGLKATAESQQELGILHTVFYSIVNCADSQILLLLFCNSCFGAEIMSVFYM